MEIALIGDASEAHDNVEKTKEASESFEWIEERPAPEWFVRVKSYNGRMQWFVRFGITGMAVRLYGPFSSKRQCLRFLNEALRRLMYDGTSMLDESQDTYRLKSETYEASFSYPIIERLIALHSNGARVEERTMKNGTKRAN